MRRTHRGLDRSIARAGISPPASHVRADPSTAVTVPASAIVARDVVRASPGRSAGAANRWQHGACTIAACPAQHAIPSACIPAMHALQTPGIMAIAIAASIAHIAAARMS
jgi:hypothetical protein